MADFTQEQLDDAITKAVAKAVEPLNTSITKLETNNAALVEEKKTAKTAADAKTAEAVREAEEAIRKSGNFDAMDSSHKERYTALETAKTDGDAASQKIIDKLTKGAAVASLSAEMALKGSEAVFGQIIQSRLGVDMRDGNAITVILDKDGKPSAATLDDFKKELSEDAALKPLLAGSQGSGGGTVNKGGSDANSKTMLRSDWKLLGVAERSEFLKTGKLVDE